MVKDAKYIIKRVIIGVLISLSIFFIKGCNVHAASLQEIIYYDSSWNTLYRGSSPDVNAVRAGVKYIRIYFSNHGITQNHSYQFSYVYAISGLNYQPTIEYSSANGIWVNDVQKVAKPSNTTLISSRQEGALTYFREVALTYQWNQTSNASNSSRFWVSMDLTHAQKITNFHLDSFSLYDAGTISSGGATQQDINNIINNATHNTQSIIANNNSNTNTIINNNNENTNKLNDTLKDNTAPSDEDINSLFDIDTGDSSSPVSDLITMPITLLQAYTNGFSASCSSVNLGSLYGHNLVLPCIQPERYLGSTLWGLIDMCVSLFLAYNVGLMCVTIYEGLTSLQDSFFDLYTPEHGPGSADVHYKPKHGGGE